MAVHRHVSDAGLRILNGSDLADRADVVVVSGHERFDFAELRGAVQAALRGAERGARAATPPSRRPRRGRHGLGGRRRRGRHRHDARSVGKPDPQLFLTALDRLGGGRALVVGDRLDADLAGARAAGHRRRARAHRRDQPVHGPRRRRPLAVFAAPTLADLLLGR